MWGGKTEMEDHEFHEYHAQIEQDRKCTDIPCCLVFIAFQVGMAFILMTALAEGDLRRLSHGFDYEGQLCGVDEAVKDYPFVFYCPKHGIPTQLSLDFPVCVLMCPTSANMSIRCEEIDEIKGTQTVGI